MAKKITRTETTYSHREIRKTSYSETVVNTFKSSPNMSAHGSGTALPPPTFLSTSSYESVYNQKRGEPGSTSSRQLAPKKSFRLDSSGNTYNNLFKADVERVKPVKPELLKASSSYAPPVHSPNPGTSQKYELKKGAYVLILHHLFKNNRQLYRKGSDVDFTAINKFFKMYKVKKIETYEDSSTRKVLKIMKKVESMNFSEFSCLIVFIMSHGKSNDQIQSMDGFYNLEQTIVEPTLRNNTLKEKPKLFFVQACKGDAHMETDAIRTATNKFDILKCFSTYEGTVALRCPESGSFFIQELIRFIDENPTKEIAEIMKMIRTNFIRRGISQAPTETSTLTKSFYFSDLKK